MSNGKKPRLIKDVRPSRGNLDVNDALRLAVADPRFAQALITEPQKYSAAFNIKDIELAAINDAIGGLAAEGFEYE